MHHRTYHTHAHTTYSCSGRTTRTHALHVCIAHHMHTHCTYHARTARAMHTTHTMHAPHVCTARTTCTHYEHMCALLFLQFPFCLWICLPLAVSQHLDLKIALMSLIIMLMMILLISASVWAELTFFLLVSPVVQELALLPIHLIVF